MIFKEQLISGIVEDFKIRGVVLEHNPLYFTSKDDNDFKMLKVIFPDLNDNELELAINDSLTSDYLKYSNGEAAGKVVEITDKGFSAAEVYRQKNEEESSKSFLRKCSDCIAEHSGITTLVSLLISVLALVVAAAAHLKN